MAIGTFYGTLYSTLSSPRIGNMGDNRLTRGAVYCSVDTCFASGTNLDAGSKMYVGRLPAGAVVLFSQVYPINADSNGAPAAMTNAVTGKLGTPTDDDLFGTVGTLKSTAVQTVVPIPDGTIYPNLLGIKLLEDTDVVFTTATAALTATEGICVKIYYTYR